jgi:hypothetical protein
LPYWIYREPNNLPVKTIPSALTFASWAVLWSPSSTVAHPAFTTYRWAIDVAVFSGQGVQACMLTYIFVYA